MSKLTIYHGSPVIIEKPQFGVGNPNNDYGLGFYCTETLTWQRSGPAPLRRTAMPISTLWICRT